MVCGPGGGFSGRVGNWGQGSRFPDLVIIRESGCLSIKTAVLLSEFQSFPEHRESKTASLIILSVCDLTKTKLD